jgi:ABC-type polysaccharide/polyol phosphate export permease
MFPNTPVIDPIRDLVLFNSWPEDWNVTLIKAIGFTTIALAFGIAITSRKLHRLG